MSGFRTMSVVAAMLVALSWTQAAAAAPRLALVDGVDAPHLHEALAVALMPWAIEVVDWPSGRAEDDDGALPLEAEAIARNANARYVVWIEAGELVVVDATLGRRDARTIEEPPADEASASALALSVKTMLRLPPALAAQGRGARWRFVPAVRVGGRFGIDGDGGGGLRAALGLEVGPPRFFGVRVGVWGELGAAADVARASFRGEWSEWNVQVAVAREFAIEAWTVGVSVGGGMSRATLEGEEMRTARSEGRTSACGGAAVVFGRALGPVQASVAASLLVRGAGQYSRDNGTVLFQEATALGAIGGQLAVPF